MMFLMVYLSVTCQAVEDNFKDTLENLRIKNPNRVLLIKLISIIVFVTHGFPAPFRLNRTNTVGGILAYVRGDIPSKLLNIFLLIVNA